MVISTHFPHFPPFSPIFLGAGHFTCTLPGALMSEPAGRFRSVCKFLFKTHREHDHVAT